MDPIEYNQPAQGWMDSGTVPAEPAKIPSITRFAPWTAVGIEGPVYMTFLDLEVGGCTGKHVTHQI